MSCSSGWDLPVLFHWLRERHDAMVPVTAIVMKDIWQPPGLYTLFPLSFDAIVRQTVVANNLLLDHIARLQQMGS